MSKLYDEIHYIFYKTQKEMGIDLAKFEDDVKENTLLQWYGFVDGLYAIARRVYVPKDIIADEIRQYLKEWVD